MVVYCSSFAKFVKNNTIVVVCFLWNELLKIVFLVFKSFNHSLTNYEHSQW